MSQPVLPDSESDFLPDFETLCAHWGEDRASYKGAVIPPIFQNSLFTYADCKSRFETWGDAGVYDYTRYSNPTTEIAEVKIAAMEGGDRARCFGSGMGALSAALLSCLKSGDHILCVESIYGPNRVFLADYLPRFQIETSFIEGSDPQQWQDACRPNTTAFMLESPSSIVMRQQDLTALAGIARERGITTLCDNSWASPYYQNPIKMGIDLVVHSATKYLGGHSDIVAGVVVGAEERMKKMVEHEGCLLGAVLDPFAAWLLIRGMRTLPIRMERHQKSAQKIVSRLREHAAIEQVFYPGQPDDPQAELSCRQLRGTSGLLSVSLKQNSKENAFRFVDKLKYFGIGCSWGGFESLAVPSPIPAPRIGKTGDETQWLIRLHIGLENVEDLWEDLENGLSYD